MIYTAYTKQAMRLAYRAHHGQTDKSSLPYILHPLHLAEQMPDEASTIAALLHDTVEDTAVTFADLEAAGFPAPALDAIRCLTHDPSVPYLDYVRALRKNPIAARVKRADLAHNSDLTRLDTVTEADLHRIRKYEQALRILTPTEVVAALIWDGDRFLIGKRPRNKARGGLWEFVGGKVEDAETPQQALVRECQEELAVSVSVGDVFMEVTHDYPDTTVHLTLFHAAIADGTPQMLEHTALRWITPAEIDCFDFCPADTDILEKIKREAM